MSRAAALLLLLFSLHAQAYSGKELLEDCQAADALYPEKRSDDPRKSVQAARCQSYLAGFADGYGVGNYLADKIGVQLNAFCLPARDDLPFRMLRAVLLHLERQPPNITTPPQTLVAGALAKAFPCAQ